jgi:hypothetical protein
MLPCCSLSMNIYYGSKILLWANMPQYLLLIKLINTTDSTVYRVLIHIDIFPLSGNVNLSLLIL